MSTDTKDGGPAFPCPEEAFPYPGMSLRDWLAGMAMTGLLANPEHANKDMDYGDFAHDAYVAADRMLAARDAKGERP